MEDLGMEADFGIESEQVDFGEVEIILKPKIYK